MNGELTLALAFLAGLAGAGHCWAMCGGFAGGLFLTAQGWRPHLGYHAGRVLAYTLLGALAAGLGQAVVLAGGVGKVQALLYVAAGVLVVAAGWRSLPFKGRVGEGMGCSVAPTQPHPPSSSPLVPRDTVPSGHKGGRAYAFAGLLNGLMPCSLVFSLTLKAAAAPSIAQGAAWLLAFGLGTVPAMAVAALLARGLGAQSLVWLRAAAGLLVMALGAEAIVAGIKLFQVLLHL